MTRLRQRLWQLPRLTVCLVRGHRWLAPFAIVALEGRYVVRGCGRCGKNTVTGAYRPNRRTRRRIAKAAR
jgi:hypothetical protein